MKITETELKDVYVIDPQVFGDHRGWFMGSWSKASLKRLESLAILCRIISRFPRKKEPCEDFIIN